MKTWLLLLMISLVSGGKVYTPDTDKEITILRFGYPSQALYQYSRLAHKYHFKLISVGGCMVSHHLVDSVDKHNKVAEAELDSLNGPVWRDAYETDVWTTYQRDTTMAAALKKEAYIHDLMDKEWKRGNGLYFYVDSDLTDNVYRIDVMGYQDTTSDFVSFFNIYMNYPKLSILRKEVVNVYH
jgi:hypothetical protein